MIDWSKPLEAVHVDERVASVTYDRNWYDDNHWTKSRKKNVPGIWNDEGMPNSKYSDWTGWRIRNVVTQEAEYPPELVERMASLVRDMAKLSVFDSHTPEMDEARAIVALLPAPIDPDLIEAREIVAKWYEDDGEIWKDVAAAVRSGRQDISAPVACALAGIKRGKGKK